ncbi:MAG: hypothetical protein FJX77_00075 [Armatimonadetes bacterium]|nr:hypothetical protein [Armatimonadota bacterium]
MAGVALPPVGDPALPPKWRFADFRLLPGTARPIGVLNPLSYNAVYGAPEHGRVWVIRYDDGDPPAPLAPLVLESAYCTTPTLIPLPDGTLHLLYGYAVTSGVNSLRWRLSEDGGATWTAATDLYSGQYDGGGRTGPSGRADGMGRVWLVVYSQPTALDPVQTTMVGQPDGSGAWTWAYAERDDQFDEAWETNLGVLRQTYTATYRTRGLLAEMYQALGGPGPNVLGCRHRLLNAAGTAYVLDSSLDEPQTDLEVQSELTQEFPVGLPWVPRALDIGPDGTVHVWYPQVTTGDFVLRRCKKFVPGEDNDWV